MRIFFLFTLVGLLVQAEGHGYMTEPPSRTGATLAQTSASPYGSSLWFNQGCTIGCKECGGFKSGAGPACNDSKQEAKLPKEFQTYNLEGTCGTSGINPWCAPGSSGVMDPCGVAGGDTARGVDAPPGYATGHKGSTLPPLKGIKPSVWRVGDAVDVAWAIVGNHGGGYQYRLCPKNSPLTEECFQQTPLEFVGDESYIQYCPYEPSEPMIAYPAEGWNQTTPENFPPEKIFKKKCDPANRTTIPAKRVRTGTFPKGSTWTQNPIPACDATAGGGFNWGCLVSTIPGKYPPVPASAYLWPPPGKDLSRPGALLGGFGLGACFGCAGLSPKHCTGNCTGDVFAGQAFQWNIVDQVRVPKVPPGEYVVSHRWDCEQNPQIWTTCSDVVIRAPNNDVVV